ncbi:MAG: hypothetical protein V4577_01290 [Bacteroidota bacterium]
MKFKITPGLILGIILLLILVLCGFVLLVSHLLKNIDTKWAAVLFAAIIISAFIYDAIEKKQEKKQKAEFLETGRLLFADHEKAFTDFYNLYLDNKRRFLSQNAQLLKNEEAFDFKSLKPVEVLYLFAVSKKLVHMVDWRDEENEKEIEGFIDGLIKQTQSWPNVSKLRANTSEDKQNDGLFIVDLFKCADKDLKLINQRLLFFELGWDAYVYTVVPAKTFDLIKGKPAGFHGVSKLKK